jgi:hypothetical protein
MKNIIILLLLMVSPVSAGIYTWTDSDGNVHFGDRPADSESAVELNITIKKDSGISNSSGNKKEREYLLKKIDEENKNDAEKKTKRIAENKKRKQKCDYYKRKYQNHIQSNRTYNMSPDGERTYLSDEQRADRKRKLAKSVSKNCK